MLAWVRRGDRISYYLLLRLTHSQLDTARALGLEEGDAHVIRNAGGRVTDALRSIVISQQLLGTREIVIIHHVCQFYFIFIFHHCQIY
jgi:hypothetical protein